MDKMGFGYQDDTDEELKSKGGGSKFGLNQGVFVTKFEYNPSAGADGAAANAIDVHIQIGEKEQRVRIYEVTRVFDKNNNEISDKTSEEFVKGYNTQQIQNSAVITHILKAFRSEEDVKTAMSAGFTSFTDWAKVCQGLMPTGFEKIPVDVFLEYQWTISKGQDRTYLQLPKNMKGGYWICKAQPGGPFKEQRAENGTLSYVNEGGIEHPFTRDQSFMDGHKGIQQVEGEASGAAISGGAATATKSTW